MFFLDFLKRAIPADDEVTRLFVDQMVPLLLNKYVVLSAKGGMHQDDPGLSEHTKAAFEQLHDQSMFTHLLNGLLSTLRLMHLLEHEGLASFSSIERMVYILAYLMHDIDKILRRPVNTIDRAAIEEAKSIIAAELEECHASIFFPDVVEYLEDITFLVVNTQQRWGTHLNTYLWSFRLPKQRIPVLRRLCTYSDHIAYLVTSPNEILQAGDIQTIVAELSQDRLTFCYHQLREVRGLLSNAINNGLVQLMTAAGAREGIWPYLFFSNGVVYLIRKNLSLHLDWEQAVDTVQRQLERICGTRIMHEAPGLSFTPKGAISHPAYYFEFLDIESYLRMLVNQTIWRTRSTVSLQPFEKLQQMYREQEITLAMPGGFLADARAIILGRFYGVIFGTILGMLRDNRSITIAPTLEQHMVAALGLQEYWEASRQIPNKGGMEYRWYWLAANYLSVHPGIDIYDGEGNLHALFTETMALLMTQASDALRQALQCRRNYLRHLPSYLQTTVEIPLLPESASTHLPDFRGELERYTRAKSQGKGKTLLCTLCNSAYPTEEQAESAVLFPPWVYKNKLPLYAGKNAGGICTICSLEFMLRQLQQKGQLRLTGSKFAALKTKYLAIYPNYFFTPETGAMVQDILNELRNVNFFALKKQLAGREIQVRDIVTSELFTFDPASTGTVSYLPEDDDDEIDEDNGVEQNEEQDISTRGDEQQAGNRNEGRYIKYEYPEHTYPGLCLFGVRADQKTTDTASWAMPALLALALPLVSGAKVVVSEMLLPLFPSGQDFLETVLFDAPCSYIARLLTQPGATQGLRLTETARPNAVRVNKVLDKLCLLVQLYQLNIETYAQGGKPEWQHLNEIARNLTTDPMYVFSYLHAQERRGEDFAAHAEMYLGLYRRVCREMLGRENCKALLDMEIEENMGNIQKCVELYTVFYRGGYESHSILKPIDTLAKAIINSPVEITEDDLFWQVQGELRKWLNRVRDHQAGGYAVFRGRDVDTKEAEALRAFIHYFYHQVFQIYCQGERGILRSRLNRFKDGCEAYYVHLRTRQHIQEQEKEPVAQ